MQQANEINVLEHIFKHDLRKGFWFSEILRTTGSNDKPRIVKILKNLRRAGLIETDKKWKMGTRKVLRLTQVGLELMSLIDNLEQIRRYSKMLSHWNITVDGDKIVYRGNPAHGMKEEILINGSHEEMYKLYHDHWSNGLEFIHEKMDKHVFLSLIHWYGNVIIKFKPNETGIRIIQAMVVDRIKKELDIMMNRFGSKISKDVFEDISMIGISYPIYEDIVKIYNSNYYLTSSQVLTDLVRKYIDSISNIADVTGMNPAEDDEDWNKSNSIINMADPNDILNPELMKAKDAVERLKIQ